MEKLILRWITWSNERTNENALPGEPDLDLDRSYIHDYAILHTAGDYARDDGNMIRLIRCYVNDELNSFDLLAIHDSFRELTFLATCVDTTWYTIYTNENN